MPLFSITGNEINFKKEKYGAENRIINQFF